MSIAATEATQAELENIEMYGAGPVHGSYRAQAVRFWEETYRDEAASLISGIPVFKERVMIEIHNPGGKDRHVKAWKGREDEYYSRYGNQYETWLRAKGKSGDIADIQGTPLSEWAFLSRGQVETFRALSIFSVEQVAEMPDTLASQLMSGYDIRSRAKRYVESAKAEIGTTKLAKELEAADGKMAAQQAQIDELTAQLKALIAASPKEGERTLTEQEARTNKGKGK